MLYYIISGIWCFRVSSTSVLDTSGIMLKLEEMLERYNEIFKKERKVTKTNKLKLKSQNPKKYLTLHSRHQSNNPMSRKK